MYFPVHPSKYLLLCSVEPRYPERGFCVYAPGNPVDAALRDSKIYVLLIMLNCLVKKNVT